MDTFPPTVPPPSTPSDAPGEATPDDAPLLFAAPGRSRSRLWAALWIVVGLVVGVPGLWFTWMAATTVPYYQVAPGDATSTAKLITATGATLYPAKGQVLYTTVSTRQMSRWDKFRFDHDLGWNNSVEVVPAKALLGDQTPDQNHKENLRVMGFSKDVAVYVALNKLGYQPTITNGGVVVVKVVDGVPAASILHPGDVIVSMDGTITNLDNDLRTVVQRHIAGDKVTATITDRDGGNRRDVSITLAKRDDGSPYVGIQTAARDDIRFQFPVDLKIDTGDVGGPSAGLAFTLGALDALTPGELTGGKKVAVTGTIDFSGNVGEIGGIKQKAVAVEHTGADVFIVPDSEAADAREGAKGSRLQVIGVKDLDGALAALAQLGGNALDLGTPGKAA